MSRPVPPDTGRLHLADALREILIDHLFLDIPAEEIGWDDDLREVLGLDSMGFVELRAQCEARFGIVITENDFNPSTFRTLARVAELILRLTGELS